MGRLYIHRSMKTHRNQTIPCRYIYHTLGPQNHEKMQVLIPRNMGERTPKNGGKRGFPYFYFPIGILFSIRIVSNLFRLPFDTSIPSKAYQARHKLPRSPQEVPVDGFLKSQGQPTCHPNLPFPPFFGGYTVIYFEGNRSLQFSMGFGDPRVRCLKPCLAAGCKDFCFLPRTLGFHDPI